MQHLPEKGLEIAMGKIGSKNQNWELSTSTVVFFSCTVELRVKLADVTRWLVWREGGMGFRGFLC